MAVRWELPLFFAVFVTICGETHHKIRHKREAVEEQPRIVTQNGHLIFQTGANHNISFKSLQGGFVNIDGIDIQTVVKSVKNNKDAISVIQGQQKADTDAHFTQLEGRITHLETWKGTHLQDIETIGQLQTDMNALKARITVLENKPDPTYPPRPPTTASSDNANRKLKRRINALETKVSNLWNKLTSNECQNQPCQNGGTCVDLYNGYICRCPDAWEGKTCNTDVNECARFAGTDLGCQNGATCRNTRGGYTCSCTANWFGVHCASQHDDCARASSQMEICGHGTCHDAKRIEKNKPKYICSCDEGWTTAGSSPACTIDVDECSLTNPPCSQHPPVTCINLPGTYHCGPCPAGYSGNGWHCVDVDECATDNGGCSQTPFVPCINTRGSMRCGPCPPGYAGNGHTCMWKGRCSTDNGGCHRLARCIETSGVLGVTCQCPDGYIGSGQGRRGCRQAPTTAPDPCSTNPCVNGRCRATGSSYTCECDTGFSGSRCQLNTDNCASAPCQHGGTCVDGLNSFRCLCPDTHTGRFCETARQNCGGELTSDTGSIKYPQETGVNYPHSIMCGWKITVSSGKVIQLTFTKFNTETTSNCQFDFLAIHDGRSRGDHKIGQYCGDNLPGGGVVNTTHNAAFLYFQSDASIARDGFELTWQAQDPVCGGDLTGKDHGTVSSPGYPGAYPPRYDCVWTITVSPGNKIMFHFATLDLETHSNCTYDYLEIHDGLRETDPLLRRFCSQADPPPLTTMTPYAWLKFHSDSSENGQGFHITYSAIPVKAGNERCGEALTDSTGVITSPNYPGNYQASITCVWTITVPEGEKIILTFTNMDLEAAARNNDCTMDYVEVREGVDENGALVGTYCGDSIPAVRTLTTNKVWVKFVTDNSAQHTGFRLTWDVACGGSFSDEAGTITSPYYPSYYPHNKVCEYVLVNPTGGQVTIKFDDFTLEQVGDDCEYDYLEVRDGRTTDAGLLHKLCGTETPNPISSNGRALYLRFVSDGSTNNKGFKLNYEMNTQTCGGALTANSGGIQSPGFPNVYPHGISCVWTIDVDPGYIIRLTFHSFSTEKTTNCKYDNVAVYDNSSYTDTGGLLGRYCGSTLPPATTSIENTMTITFQTDGSVAHEGFMATYIALNSSHLCGGQLMTQTGEISSPNYPDNYPHLRECIWTIVIPEGHQIMLNVTDFQMEQHGLCKYDFLEIRNGGYPSSPLMGQFCGTAIPQTFVSQSNRMFLKFKTDNSDSGKGFKIFYDGRASGCGADLTSPSGSFISPNFPLPYGHHAECFWTITVSEGSTVMLLFAEFDLEHGTNCNYDYLEIRDRDRNGQVLGKLCSSVIPQPVNSKTNRIWVKFKTDYSSHGRGFHAVYHSNCEVTLTSVSGVIESPNFPELYPGKRSCAWKIQSTKGNTLNVSFSHFDLEQQSSCTSDYLQVFDGVDTTSNSLGRYCGNQLPPNFASSSRYLLIKFESDYSIAGTGFRLEWLTNGCGANLKGRTGTFKTPNYPNPSSTYKECIWTIEVEPGQRVELTFQDMDIESTGDCRSDHVEVFGGPDQFAPSLTKLCHTSRTAQKVMSTGNYMYIRFLVEGGNTGKGFNASYKAIIGGCGGNYTTKSGSLMSPNYPGNYPHNTDCSWMITVEKNANIELVVEDFAMEITTSRICQYDYVAFYDGPDQNSRLVQKLCGKNISENASVITHGNQLYIRMRSDSSVTDKGFKAVYTTGCGGMQDATTDGEITSPNYPEAYAENKNCTWVIQSPQSGDRVTLTFTYMDIKKTEDCASDHVQVHEGDDEYSPLIGSYCGQRIPPSFTSRGSSLTVVFSSENTVDRATRGHGFRAVYTSATGACGGDLTSQHGAFVSPEYGVNYPLNRECVWTIGGPPGSKVQISARDFSIPSTANCDNDFLDVRDGGEASRKRWRFCGTDIPANMSFTNNKLWVRFRSSGSIPSGQTFTGFYFYYSLVYGGDVTGESGKIASPNYPKLYPNKLDIEWIITVAVGKRIRIVFEYIDVENNPQCFYDQLTFRDGGTSDDLTISAFCGFEKPAPFLSTGNQLNIKFHSDWNREGHGFLFRWEATDEGTVRTTASPGSSNMNVTCGETLIVTDRVQNLTSPGYPNSYANRINCVWKMEAPAGSKVWVNVTRVGIEGVIPSCNYDKLEFYDGDGLESPKLTTLCGRQITGDAVISTSTVMTVRFYTDVGLNGIGFTADVRTACGGLMTSPVGVIKSPGSPNAYGANQNCTWKFQVTNGRKLALSFSNFNIRSTTGCSEDYLQLTDGAFANSPPLGNGTNGRYCGSTTPKLPEQSSSNTLIVTFISSPTSPGGPGFSLTYREVTITCGGRLTLTNDVQSGEFMSHGYPIAYPANIDCIWIITAPSRDGVQVDFHGDFDIEKHAECKFDNIEVRDGGTENAPVIGRYCGPHSPGTIKSSGNVLYIRFRTDDSIPRKGFKATYKIATCGGTIRGKDGFISGPNFPHTYPSNTVCEWHIYGLTGHYLTLTFTDFRLASSDNCTNDFVEVREYNATGRLFGTYCGLTIPTLGDTSDSYAYVKFKSDNTIGENGFKLKFESGISECGGELVTPSGVITTPNYPGLYPHMRVCTWNIKVQQGRRVTLTFDDFKLEEGVNCFFDHVRVNNGIIDEGPTIAKLCGGETPDVIESSANTMAVIFKTDSSVSNGGFRATYKSDNPARCGGEVAEGLTTGIIMSPNFDLGYYNHSELCIWTITNHNLRNTSISLTFVDFEMETHWACAFDYLKIVETSNQEDRLVDRLCGNKTHPPIVSPSPKLTLMFRTDQSLSMVGFKLRWKFQACGGFLTADTGSITSPNYPRNYDQNDFCAWEILAPEGYQIKISFQDINIEEHSKCESDFLKILNGGSASSPPIGKFCGTDTPKDITSQSNQLRLEFHTDYSLAAKGFKLHYSFVSGGCGGVMHSLNGSIVKPSTSGLTPQTECIWDITVPYGFHVRFQFTAMKFDCSKKEEFVEVLDIGKGGLTISTKTFCVRDGDILPDVYAGKTNKLRIRYRTPNVQSANTFASNWSVGCGYLLTEDEGIVMSPLHPRSYPGGLDCNYTISVDPQKFILLEFDDDQFGIERAQIATNNSGTPLIDDIACKFDFVAIYDGFNETDAKLIGKFCGKKAPQPMSTLANMIVRFKSDATVGDVGFLANYRASECGGVYTDAYGQIKTPQHPVKYHKSANCSWLITVQDNRAIQLKFSSFDIELHRACSFDYVQVFDGNSTDAPSLGRFCGNVVPRSLRTTGNQMLVNFKSDHSIQLGGFTAAYQTTFGIQQGCGGTLNGATGRISSIDIDYDGRYENNQDCIWQIMADAGKVIKLSFSVFATEGPMAGICRYDFVEIRDGYTFESPLAGRFCGGQAPQPFTSSSNRLYLRFKSDNSDNALGFNATWEQEDAQCGGYFNLTKAGRFNISSPNYPLPYPHGLRCRWIVEAPVGKHIMVNMTNYNIKCGYAQTLEVRDMPLGTHGKNIYFCRPETPRIFYSLNNTIEIDLSTDQTSTGKGFNLTYEIITCNRTYTGNNGHIYSPGWPMEYDHSANCTMFIQAPPGHKISIFFNTFGVEMHSKCRYDFLAFEDPAISDNTTLLRKYCGRLLPDPLFTDLNRLRLRFQSDSSLSSAGFDINYITSPTAGCGGNLTSSNGSFTSPGYPGNQTDASDCVWLLHAPVNTRDRGRLELTFLDFNMGGSQGTCGDNYIEVKNGLSSAAPILGKYCGMEKPSKLLLRNDGYIRYKTDGKMQGTGFRLSFQYSNERSSR